MTDKRLIEKALSRAFSLGQTYWQQADSDSWKENKKSSSTREDYNHLVQDTLALFSSGQKPAAWRGVHVEGDYLYYDDFPEELSDEQRRQLQLEALYSNPIIPSEQQTPVAKIISSYGDPESFGEREVKVLVDLMAYPYNTNLYAAITETKTKPILPIEITQAKIDDLIAKNTKRIWAGSNNNGGYSENYLQTSDLVKAAYKLGQQSVTPTL